MVSSRNQTSREPLSRPEGHPPGATPELAELKESWSSERRLTRGQQVVAALLALGLLVGFVLEPVVAASALVGFFVVVFLVTAGYRCLYFLSALRSPPAPRPPAPRTRELPVYSILVPLYREANVAGQLVEALTRIDYPKEQLDVLLLVEHDDAETRAAVEEVLPDGWRIVVVPPGRPRTKPRALNEGLPHVRGELFTIYDAEDRPDPDQLRKAVAEFAQMPPEVACLQARLDFYNSHQNLLTKWFTCEYATHFGLILKGMAEHRHPLPLGGTSTHFRTSVVRQLGGWDAWNVTEDTELGMRLATAGWETRMLDSVTWEEALPVPRRWFRQRSHWIKGYLQTGLALLRRPLRTGRAMGWRRYAAALSNIAGTGVVLLFWPLFWLLLWLYIGLRAAGVDVTPIESAFPGPILALGLVSLLAGNFVILLAHVSAVYNLGRYDLVRYALTVPFYWALAWVGGWLAAAQLVSKPHFWEKTTHGLSEEPAERPARPTVEVLPVAATPGIDGWSLLAPLLTAVGLAGALGAALRADLVFGYSDSASHVVIPRRVFDNAEPGFEQLGTHWAPLFHVLQLPLVWLDPLYRSGASGILVSALASLVTSFFLYRLVVLVGGTRLQGLAAAAILVASPSFLYSGVIPMLPATIMATATANVYFLTRWALRRQGWDLLFAGLTLTLATLTHYDTWILLPLELLVVLVVARRGWRSRPRTEASVLLWGLAGGYGVAVFGLMNIMIYGRPFAFLDRYTRGVVGGGPAPEAPETATELSPLADYPLAAWLNAGPVLGVVAVLGALLFVWAARSDVRRLVPLLLLYPFLFYFGIAAVGVDFIGADPTLGHWVNLRYGTPILPAFAFLAAVGFRNRILLGAAVAAVVVGAVLMIRNDRVAAWEDARLDVPVDGVVHEAARWVGERAGGAKIFMPVHDDLIDRFQLESGLPASAFIDPNDTRTWLDVHAEPDTMFDEGVEWIVWMGGRGEEYVEPLLAAIGARQCYEVTTQSASLRELRIYALGRDCAEGGST